jgi:hypothetical protein
LYSLLILSRGFRATDPRDKIFALLTLAVDREDFPKPNYSWPLEKVYRRFARSLIRQGHGLGILSLAGIQASPLFDSSWIPDWRQDSPFWNFHTRSDFCAGGRVRCVIVETNERSLIAPANQIDNIKFVCPFVVDQSGLLLKMAKLINDAIESILEERLVEINQQSSLDYRFSLEKQLLSLLFCDFEGVMRVSDTREAKKTSPSSMYTTSSNCSTKVPLS